MGQSSHPHTDHHDSSLSITDGWDREIVSVGFFQRVIQEERSYKKNSHLLHSKWRGTKDTSAFSFRSVFRWLFVSKWLSNLWCRWKYRLRRSRRLLQTREGDILITRLRRLKGGGERHHSFSSFPFLKSHIILSELMSCRPSNRHHLASCQTLVSVRAFDLFWRRCSVQWFKPPHVRGLVAGLDNANDNC